MGTSQGDPTWGFHMGSPHGDQYAEPTWETHMPTCLVPIFPAYHRHNVVSMSALWFQMLGLAAMSVLFLGIGEQLCCLLCFDGNNFTLVFTCCQRGSFTGTKATGYHSQELAVHRPAHDVTQNGAAAADEGSCDDQ